MKRVFACAFCIFGLTVFTPGVDAQSLDARLKDAATAGQLPGLHSAIVDLGDERLAEVYFQGADETWGVPLGDVAHGPETLHDLRSVTKSVTGLLYGIALSQGKVPTPDAPLYAQFADYADLRTPERDKIRVADALTMQMGLHWDENLPYTDPRNSEIAMELAPDRYRFVLEQAVVQPPGQSWTYSGGATALIGKLISDGTGQPLDAYAKDHLFAPLGITDFEWIKGQDGVPSPASGLRLTLPDLARIGQLVAQDGYWEGRQIVPQDWIVQSLTPRTRINNFMQYGYLWYLVGPEGTTVAAAMGNGGQRLTVQPNRDLVVASFAGRYNDPDAWQIPLKVFVEFAVPAAKEALSRQ